MTWRQPSKLSLCSAHRKPILSPPRLRIRTPSERIHVRRHDAEKRNVKDCSTSHSALLCPPLSFAAFMLFEQPGIARALFPLSSSATGSRSLADDKAVLVRSSPRRLHSPQVRQLEAHSTRRPTGRGAATPTPSPEDATAAAPERNPRQYHSLLPALPRPGPSRLYQREDGPGKDRHDCRAQRHASQGEARIARRPLTRRRRRRSGWPRSCVPNETTFANALPAPRDLGGFDRRGRREDHVLQEKETPARTSWAKKCSSVSKKRLQLPHLLVDLEKKETKTVITDGFLDKPG